MKQCQYRNCSNSLTNKQTKYCCREHKNMESTYIKRKKVLLEKWKEEELKKVELIKMFKESGITS